VRDQVMGAEDAGGASKEKSIGDNRYRIYGELFAELSARRSY